LPNTLGRSNPRAALRFLDAFDQTVAKLALLPGLGSPYESSHPHLQEVRILPVARFKKYWIFYRPLKNKIEVLRVLYCARDLDAALEE
jgi:plasmid stabilization system protein ParE